MLVVGADQGQGAWHSWIKIATMSGTEIRKKIDNDASYKPKNSYIIAQVAHIECKKTILKFYLQLFPITSPLLTKHCRYPPWCFLKSPKRNG
jgi:hypothetical protein